MLQNAAIETIQSLYLNPNGADVWFSIHGERVPGHKLILGAMCPYYSTMFYGSLPADDEVDMSTSNVSFESFKEFLRFMYGLKPNLTMENIEGVISLAKQSLKDDIFAACEEYLTKNLTIDTMFFGYQLALLYDANHLKQVCEEEICVKAEEVLKSSSFLKFPYEFLQIVLQWDALACEEFEIFEACIEWAKAACKAATLATSNIQTLRGQLRDLVHHIRFTSMTKEEAAKCIKFYPGLFTANELEEIICMVAHEDQFTPKQFNWTPRYFNLEWNKGRQLHFYRRASSSGATPSRVNQLTSSTVTCNKRVLLKEFQCEIQRRLQTPIHVIIKEIKNQENWIERYNERIMADFDTHYTKDGMDMYEAKISLNKAILLRPNYTYEISIECDAFGYLEPIYRYSNLSTKRRVDHDITFNFDNQGIVVGLSVYRLDDKNFFQKVIYNPKTWMLFVGGLVCIGFFWKINSR